MMMKVLRCIWRLQSGDTGSSYSDRPLPFTMLLNEADAISDGKCAFVPAVMEHIELAEFIRETRHVLYLRILRKKI